MKTVLVIFAILAIIGMLPQHKKKTSFEKRKSIELYYREDREVPINRENVKKVKKFAMSLNRNLSSAEGKRIGEAVVRLSLIHI